MTETSRTYADSGVNHDAMDVLKVLAQKAARETSRNADRLGIQATEDTLGESVRLFRNGDHYIGHLSEGLGTKNIVAELMELESGLTGLQYFHEIMQDNFAMIANDCVTLGPIPFSMTLQIDIGSTRWLKEMRIERLILGWRRGCDIAGAVWAGGETATLRDIVNPTSAVLGGSAVGKTIGLTRFSADYVEPGDVIIGFESSGVHANGITLLRDLVDKLPHGYWTYDDALGRTFGEAILQPTHIYVPAIEALIRAGVPIHYGINITGHGWRKLMRARQDFTYEIDTLPTQFPIFNMIQRLANMTRRNMYRDYNMGLGFVLIIPPTSVEPLFAVVREHHWPFKVFKAGLVKAGPKRVVITPEDFEPLEGDEMKLRI